MNQDQSAEVGRLTRGIVTRRAVLGSGSALGLSAATGAAFALPSLPGARPAKAAKIVFDYKPSQVTGWSPPYSPTQGGHHGVSDFTWKGKSYRVSLLSFGQPGNAPHPVYTAVPSDTRVNFKRTLAAKWGKYYTFRYLGGLPSGAYFTVESYGAFHGRPANPLVRNPGVIVGADLYAVYHPGGKSSHPAVNSDLQFIQVVDYQIAPSPPESRDDTDRANPFYGEGGGLTSINGAQSLSFSDFVREGFNGTVLPANFFVAETFLAQDTRTKDRTGRDIVNIFGGIRWGWQLRNLG